MKAIATKRIPEFFLLIVFLLGITACQPPKDNQYTVDDLQAGLGILQEAVETLEDSIDTSSHQNQQSKTSLILESGDYPPGMYAGPCAVKRKPDELTIGMKYEVISIISEFARWDEEKNVWIGVGQTSAPRNAEEFASPPEPPKAGIHLGGMVPIRAPGKYKITKSGAIQNFVVEKAQTVGGGPVPRRISQEEVYEEILFTITNN